MGVERMRVAVGFGTSRGRVREINEDSYCVFTPYPGSEDSSEFSAVLGVADGMGGHQAGDVASSFVVEKLNTAFVRGGYREKYGMLPDLALILKNVIRDINQELFLLSRKGKSPAQMGSTLTFGFIKDKTLWVAHVGDSRCYVLAEGKVEQLTKDHSWVAEQVRHGILSKEEAIGHPQDNVITQAIGIDPNVEPQILVREVKEGEQYLFCTDGLTKHVSEKDILETVNSHPHPQRACDRLIELANQRGGEDNITVVLGYVGVREEKKTEEEVIQPGEKAGKGRSWARAGKIFWSTFCVLALLVAGFFMGIAYQKRDWAKKVDKLLVQGEMYFQTGEMDKAAALAQSVLSIDRKNKAAQELRDKIKKEEEKRRQE